MDSSVMKHAWAITEAGNSGLREDKAKCITYTGIHP